MQFVIYEPIPKITSQKLNENLKKCAEILGWDERVVLTRYRGARPIRKEFRRYELTQAMSQEKRSYLSRWNLVFLNES